MEVFGKMSIRKKGTIKRTAAVAMSSAMALTCFAGGSVNAFASAPQSAMTISDSDSVITATAHRAAAPLIDMLGANAVAGFGMLNGTAPSSLATANASLGLNVWGTSMNTNPDPYYWNYYYNFYATANGLTTATKALVNPSAAASPCQADLTTTSSETGVSASLFARPQLVVGVSGTSTAYNSAGTAYDYTGYASQLATIQDSDPDYNPSLVAYDPTSLATMVSTVNSTANAMYNLMYTSSGTSTGVTARYGNPKTIASEYQQYVEGLQGYVYHKVSTDSSAMKKIAIITGGSTSAYTIIGQGSQASTSTNRYVEYTNGLTDNICDDLLAAAGNTTATSTTISLSDLESEGVDAVIVTDSSLLTGLSALGSGVEIISAQPSTLYGVTMNSVENAFGLAYYIGRIYDNDGTASASNVLTYTNGSTTSSPKVTELCEYFYSHFLHVTDPSALAVTTFAPVTSATADTGKIAAPTAGTYTTTVNQNVTNILSSGTAYYSAYLASLN